MKKITILTLAILSLTLVGCARVPATKLAAGVKVKRVWRTRTSKGTHTTYFLKREYLRLQPVMNRGRIFTAGYQGRVAAVAASNGRLLWQDNTKNPLTSGVGAGSGKVFVGSGYGRVFAIDQDSGHLVWQKQLSSEILATPTVARGVVLVKCIDGKLYALSARNGHTLWTYSQQVPSLILRANSSPSVSRNKVAAGFANGNLAALQFKNGQPLWVRPVAIAHGATAINRMIDIDVEPQIVGNIVYVATYQGRISALNLHTGRTLWKYKLSSYSGLTVGHRNVYITDAQGNIWAFNRLSGLVAWKQHALHGRMLTGPVKIGDMLAVAGSHGYIFFVSQHDGHFLARIRPTHNGFYVAPLVRGNHIYAYANNGYLYNFIITD